MFLIAVSLLMAAPSDRWVQIGGSPNLYDEHLDTQSVRRSGDGVTLWTRRDWAGNRRTSWNELEFDCPRKRVTILAYVQIDGEAVSHSVRRPHRRASPILSDTVEQRIFDIVCG
jgi:hypothetical protein